MFLMYLVSILSAIIIVSMMLVMLFKKRKTPKELLKITIKLLVLLCIYVIIVTPLWICVSAYAGKLALACITMLVSIVNIIWGSITYKKYNKNKS